MLYCLLSFLCLNSFNAVLKSSLLHFVACNSFPPLSHSQFFVLLWNALFSHPQCILEEERILCLFSSRATFVAAFSLSYILEFIASPSPSKGYRTTIISCQCELLSCVANCIARFKLPDQEALIITLRGTCLRLFLPYVVCFRTDDLCANKPSKHCLPLVTNTDIVCKTQSMWIELMNSQEFTLIGESVLVSGFC